MPSHTRLTHAGKLHTMAIGKAKEDLLRQGGSLGRLASKLRSTIKQVHRMFELLVGLLFLIMAAGTISLSLAQWRNYLKDPSAGLGLFYLSASFSVLLIFCSLYSFLKARSIR